MPTAETCEELYTEGSSMQENQAPPRVGRDAHVALSLGSEQRVDALTERSIQDGFAVLEGPRRTGDGYYESVVLDPDGNRIEIAA